MLAQYLTGDFFDGTLSVALLVSCSNNTLVRSARWSGSLKQVESAGSNNSAHLACALSYHEVKLFQSLLKT